MPGGLGRVFDMGVSDAVSGPSRRAGLSPTGPPLAPQGGAPHWTYDLAGPGAVWWPLVRVGSTGAVAAGGLPGVSGSTGRSPWPPEAWDPGPRAGGPGGVHGAEPRPPEAELWRAARVRGVVTVQWHLVGLVGGPRVAVERCPDTGGDVRTQGDLFSPPPGRAPPAAKTKVARRGRR